MRFSHPPATFLALLALIRVACCQERNEPAKVVKLHWTTDGKTSGNPLHLGTIGPDGPWQALTAFLGTQNSSKFIGNKTAFPLWPSPWSNVSEIMWSRWQPFNAEMQAAFNVDNYTRREPESFGNWLNHGTRLRDWDMSIPSIHDEFNQFLYVKAPAAALRSSTLSLEDGMREGQNMGETLALAPNNETGSRSILQQLKDAGNIGSNSFGLHMGAPKWNQSGSMILGGFNKKRVVGEIATFDLMDKPESVGQSYLPRIYLSYVWLGQDVGGSPFDFPNNWQGEWGIMDEIPLRSKMNSLRWRQTNGRGLPYAAMVVPDPTVPLFYLPPGTCENAAKYLPVTLDEKLNLWIWNTTDPRHRRIVDSPAYMSFTLRSDRRWDPGQDSFPDIQRVSIKVPFQLLDLEVEFPILPEQNRSLRYFPCRSVEPPEGYWKLGRAFLQSAFLGVNYDRDLVYLGQAAGPDIDDSNALTSIDSEDEYLTERLLFSYPSSDWVQTWKSYWTALPDVATGTPSNTSTSMIPTEPGLTTAAKIGLGVGLSAAGIIVLAVLCWFRIRRQKRKSVREGISVANAPAVVTPSASPPKRVGTEEPPPPYSP